MDKLISSIQETTECFLCLNEMKNATMCPHCKKNACEVCFNVRIFYK